MENARNLHKSSKGICPALMQNASNSAAWWKGRWFTGVSN